MKKSVFLAYADDSDDDVMINHHNGNKFEKNTKQKEKQKAKKQEVNALKSLAMSTSKKSKKKKNTTNLQVDEPSTAPQAIEDIEITKQLEQVNIVNLPNEPVSKANVTPIPAPSTVPATSTVSSYAEASASGGKKKKRNSKQSQTASQVQQQPTAKPTPARVYNPSQAATHHEVPRQESKAQPERLHSPPPPTTPPINGVVYAPAQIKVLLPGQPDQVLEVAEVMARAQYFKQTAESLMAVNRNGEMENGQLRDHLSQVLARLEQVEHENRVLHQLNVNLQTEVAGFRMLQQNGTLRPPGL